MQPTRPIPFQCEAVTWLKENFAYTPKLQQDILRRLRHFYDNQSTSPFICAQILYALEDILLHKSVFETHGYDGVEWIRRLLMSFSRAPASGLQIAAEKVLLNPKIFALLSEGNAQSVIDNIMSHVAPGDDKRLTIICDGIVTLWPTLKSSHHETLISQLLARNKPETQKQICSQTLVAIAKQHFDHEKRVALISSMLPQASSLHDFSCIMAIYQCDIDKYKPQLEDAKASETVLVTAAHQAPAQLTEVVESKAKSAGPKVESKSTPPPSRVSPQTLHRTDTTGGFKAGDLLRSLGTRFSERFSGVKTSVASPDKNEKEMVDFSSIESKKSERDFTS